VPDVCAIAIDSAVQISTTRNMFFIALYPWLILRLVYGQLQRSLQARLRGFCIFQEAQRLVDVGVLGI
jgi:hypothetical protein